MTDTILEKVRKLLATAEDPACTLDEAAAFTDKAAQLIAKYGVDRALLAQTAPETDPVGDLIIGLHAPYALDKSGLLAGVAGALRCRSVRREHWQGDRRSYTMHLFGFASDLERVDLLYTSLLVQASYGLASAPVPRHENVAAYRRSWLIGFTSAVVGRLRAAESRAAAAAEADARAEGASVGESVALVLADRSVRVDAAVSEAYPRLRSAGPRLLRGSGASRGYAAGERADLGAGRSVARMRAGLAR
jgi:Protein of unknown function (DUF2786)